jgi:hypothetical protein
VVFPEDGTLHNHSCKNLKSYKEIPASQELLFVRNKTGLQTGKETSREIVRVMGFSRQKTVFN